MQYLEKNAGFCSKIVKFSSHFSLTVMLELENQVIPTEDVTFLDLMSVIETFFKTIFFSASFIVPKNYPN
jgi:hypothetical protein